MLLGCTIVLHVDIHAAAGCSHLLTHILIEGRHHGITRIVLHIVASTGDGNRGAVGRTNTQHIDAHPFLLGGFGCLEGPTFVILTIGNDDNSLSDAFLLGETVRCHIDGCCKIGSLRGNHTRVDTAEEHLGRDIVARDGQLHEGITSEDDQADLIVVEVVDEILNHHLAPVETAGDDILCPHRVGDIHRDDSLNARTLLLTDLRTHLWTGQHHNQQGKGGLQKPELHHRTEARHVGHQALQQLRIAELAEPLLLVTIGYEPDECQYGYQHQQPEIYGVFKSKHFSLFTFHYSLFTSKESS